MSRLALKLYAVLLIMGAAPLVASAVLISEVLTFDKDLQEEALETIEDVALFHREWARAEADHVELIGENLAHRVDDHGGAIWAGGDVNPEDLEPWLHEQVKRYEVLWRAELVEGDVVLLEVAPIPLPGPEALKLRTRSWQVGADVAAVPRQLRLTFGVDKRLIERYEALGERRNLHRGLALLEDEQTGSLSEVSQKFYYLMLALVIVLTICFALLITTPISRGIARLAAGTRQVAKGDLSVVVPVKGSDELAQLAGQFNNMVAELRDARRNLAYLERMSAWQEVARRLAHEIKNPLTPLLLAIQQLDKTFDKYLTDPDRYRRLVTEVVEIVTEEVETLGKLVREFSEFARLPTATPVPRDFWQFTEQTVRSNPQFMDAATVDLGDHVAVRVRLDPALMRRVIVNVVQNGIEAVREVGGEPHLWLGLCLADGGGLARVTVRDNGPGLSEEQLERVFEPYFTTKEAGTGLGLAIVRKIMLDHGGDISLRNRDDGATGAEVWIDLPVLSESLAIRLESNAPKTTLSGSEEVVDAADDPAPMLGAEDDYVGPDEAPGDSSPHEG